MSKGSVFRIIINGALWSFLGVILTVAFFYWSEYRNPYDLRMLIEDEFDLVEVREKIEHLKILYRGDDILTAKKQIKVLTLSIRNNGKTILQQDYDQTQPFGIRFGNALILSAEVVHSNSPYLQSGILQVFLTQRKSPADSILHTATDQLIFPKLILEQGKFVNLKMYLLQQATGEPLAISVLGKIANIDSISAIRLEKPKVPEKIFDIKDFGYFLGVYFALLVLLISATAISEKLDNRKRRRRCEEFLSKNKNLSADQLAIVEVYRSKWNSTTERLIQQLSEGSKVIDAREIIPIKLQLFVRKPFRWIVEFPSMFRRLQYIDLPSEIFSVEGTAVTLRAEYQQFIELFFREVGVLK